MAPNARGLRPPTRGMNMPPTGTTPGIGMQGGPPGKPEDKS